MRQSLGHLALIATLIASALVPSFAAAQTPATVSGTVRERGGNPVRGVMVLVDGLSTGVTTDSAGRFAVDAVHTGSVALTFTRSGYEDARIVVARDSQRQVRNLSVSLIPLITLTAVSVVAERVRPLLNTKDAATGGAVERRELANLPTDARNPLTLAFTIPGVSQATGFFGDAAPLSINAENSLYTQYTIDGLDNNEGFLGGPRVEFPLAGIERFSVLANTYPAEWGRSANGVVNLETRAGSDRWHGETFLYSRPGIPLDAKPKFAPSGIDPKGFRRRQIGGALGGPLSRDNNFWFGTAEYTSEQEDRIGSTARTKFLGTEIRHTLKVFSRLDHGWTPNQTTTVRLAGSDVSREGQGGGIIVPEADITTRRIGSLASMVHLSAFRGGRASNSASLQVGTFHWFFPPSRSDFNTPQVTVLARDSVTAEAVVGSSNFIFDERETQLQLRDVMESRFGHIHTLRAGGDMTRGMFRLFAASTNPSGSYSVIDEGNINPSGPFLSIRDIPSNVRVLSYSIDAAPQHVNRSQTLYGAFVEDQLRLSESLSTTVGLRWDYDDITSRGESNADLTNFQPRLAANWLVDANTVVRAGAGMYSGKFPYAVYSDAIQFGPTGNAVVTLQGTASPPPAFLKGPSASSLAGRRSTFPPQEERRLFALGLKQPRSAQLSLGFSHEFAGVWAFSLDWVWMNTRHLPRSFDLNADTKPIGPADTVNLATTAGDPFRPIKPVAGGFRRLTTTESGGKSSYVGLYTNIRRQISESWTTEATWVWSRQRNNTEDINFNASHANDYGAEWADGINDRRHKITVRSFHKLSKSFALSGIADFQTGTPINRVARFRDLDGSGPVFGNGFVGNYDRFFGVARNTERLPSSLQLGVSAQFRVPLGERGLDLRADVFNLLNATVVSGFANGIPGGGPRTQVGRPGDPIVYGAAAPPRQIQLSAQYAF